MWRAATSSSSDYPDFHEQFGFFLPLAGITTVKQIRENAFDLVPTHSARRTNRPAGPSGTQSSDPLGGSLHLRREGPEDPERQAGANTAAGRTWTPILRPPTLRNRAPASKGRTPGMVSAGIPRKRTSKPSARKGGQGSSLGPELARARRQVTSVLVQPDGS